MNWIEAGSVHRMFVLVICGQVYYEASGLMNRPRVFNPLEY